MNAATAFLDGSSIYGSSEEEAADLRTFESGLLRTSAGDLLPVVGQDSSSSSSIDNHQQQGHVDSPALRAVQTLLMRQHNRLAQQLTRINPMWDDDTLYHEARRLVVAQMQHVTYREYLPAILGENLAENLRLTPQPSARFFDYDIDAYPGTLQAASQAALAFSLAMLPAKFDTFTMTGVKNGEMAVNTTGHLNAQQTEELLYGLVNTLSRKVGLHVAREVRRYGTSSKDRVVEVILRGRDHGLPGYAAWRLFCGLAPVTSFDDLTDIIPASNIVLLSSVYGNVADVDLFTGALAETPLKGAVVGPTLGCILAHQFALLRKSDRFWYENDVPPSSFTREQLQEIRKSSLAGLLCQNFDNFKSMSPQVFHEKDSFL